MDATWITVAFVITATIAAGAVLAIVIPICAAHWARTRSVEADARLRQEMLARGLSVADIERLSTSDQVRKVQIAADLKRDMLARGLSVDDIECLSPSDGETSNPVQPVQSLIHILVAKDASGETLETVVAAYQAADVRSKRLLYQAIVGVCSMVHSSDEQIRGVVRGLCRRATHDWGDDEKADSSSFEPPLEVPEIDGKGSDSRIRVERGAATDRPRD
jgi:hypothetical protein